MCLYQPTLAPDAGVLHIAQVVEAIWVRNVIRLRLN
jgi:hypothetical protein